MMSSSHIGNERLCALDRMSIEINKITQLKNQLNLKELELHGYCLLNM